MKYHLTRIVEIFKMWLWGKLQQTIWHAQAQKDKLEQIIFRLEINQSTADNRAALVLAKELYKRVYRK